MATQLLLLSTLILVGFLFLLGVGTAVWWITKSISAFIDSDHQKPREFSRPVLLQQLRAAAEKDLEQGRITAAFHEQLSDYLRQQQKMQPPETAGSGLIPILRSYELSELAVLPVGSRESEAAAPAGAPVISEKTQRKYERLRYLQSVGIVGVFLFVVTFIHNQVWADATALQKLSLLIMASLLAYGTGFALCRWTRLRLTGLGFSALAHFSLFLNCNAAVLLLKNGDFASGFWLVGSAVFTATAALHAWALRETFFNALITLGALGTWGFAALSLSVPVSLLLPTYVAPLIAMHVLGSRLNSAGCAGAGR